MTMPGVGHSSDLESAIEQLINHIYYLNQVFQSLPPDIKILHTKRIRDAALKMDNALIDLKHGKISLERTELSINLWAGKIKMIIKAYQDES
jgi:hypothetical protein